MKMLPLKQTQNPVIKLCHWIPSVCHMLSFFLQKYEVLLCVTQTDKQINLCGNY